MPGTNPPTLPKKLLLINVAVYFFKRLMLCKYPVNETPGKLNVSCFLSELNNIGNTNNTLNTGSIGIPEYNKSRSKVKKLVPRSSLYPTCAKKLPALKSKMFPKSRLRDTTNNMNAAKLKSVACTTVVHNPYMLQRIGNINTINSTPNKLANQLIHPL